MSPLREAGIGRSSGPIPRILRLEELPVEPVIRHVVGSTGEYDVSFGHHHDDGGRPIWVCTCKAWWFSSTPVAARRCKHVRRAYDALFGATDLAIEPARRYA